MTKAELITTGAELLNGSVTNGHARALGSMLGRLGIPLARDTTVVDDPALIVAAIKTAFETSDLIFITGGLGPTQDDLTREALCEALDLTMTLNTEVLEHINERYAMSGSRVTEGRERQAMILDGADALLNPVGSAPGQRLTLQGKTLFVLPGPPPEFISIMQHYVLEWIAQHMLVGAAPLEKIFMLAGIGESEIVKRLREEKLVSPEVEIAFCAMPGRVELRLTSINLVELELSGTRVAENLAEHIFADRRMALEQIIGERLVGAKKTLAVAESCTGGMLGGRFTSVPGSSSWFKGGIISYSNEVKTALLGVSAKDLKREGAVSRSVAEQMARGVCEKLGTDYGIGITGIAGPEGGSEEKPVGLVYIALATPSGIEVKRNTFRGDREMVREFSVQRAMGMLWRALTA
ncbi:MAG: nicotinamide-nucleotide amidase [Kiritimatiellia bacterium]|jgi:nicotinamide-nucleotide amidase